MKTFAEKITDAKNLSEENKQQVALDLLVENLENEKQLHEVTQLVVYEAIVDQLIKPK